MPPLHPLRVVRARRSLVVATRVCWRTTHTNEVCISGHFRIFRSACCARKSLSRSRLLGHFRLQFPCLVTGERPRRPQDAGERPRRPQDAGERPRRPQDAGERPRRPPATGRRRAPQTATGRRRAPQTATGRRRAPQTATGRRRAPQTATGRRRAPQTATGRRRAPQTATGRRRAPQTATGRRRAPLFSARSQPRPGPGWRVWNPPETPFFYLIHLGRAPARAYARA